MNYTDNFDVTTTFARSFVRSNFRIQKKCVYFFTTHSFACRVLNRNLIQMTDKKTDRREMDHGPTSEQHFRFKFLINFTEISDGGGVTFFFQFPLCSAGWQSFWWKFTKKKKKQRKKKTVLSNIDMLTCWSLREYNNYCCSQFLFLFCSFFGVDQTIFILACCTLMRSQLLTITYAFDAQSTTNGNKKKR